MNFRKILPFWIWPYSWGLSGKDRELAKARYELDGYDLESAILDIEYRGKYNSAEYCRQTAELKHFYNKISEKEYNQILIDLIEDPKQKEIAQVEYNYKNGNLPQLEYEKKIATLRGEPWVAVVDMSFGHNSNSPSEGSFELDWNDEFIKTLEASGYVGEPDAMVNIWFVEVCKNIALEEYDGVGNFNADADANIESLKQQAEYNGAVLKSYR